MKKFFQSEPAFLILVVVMFFAAHVYDVAHFGNITKDDQRNKITAQKNEQAYQKSQHKKTVTGDKKEVGIAD